MGEGSGSEVGVGSEVGEGSGRKWDGDGRVGGRGMQGSTRERGNATITLHTQCT